MTDVQPKYAETSYTVDPNSPIPDEAPPAAGTSTEEAEAIKGFQENATESQKLERQQAAEQAREWQESDKPRPTEMADRVRGSETTEAPQPEQDEQGEQGTPEAPQPEQPEEGTPESEPVNPDTQTTTLPSEVEDDKQDEQVPDGSSQEVLAWVSCDSERAKQALEVERQGKNRPGLISQLEAIA